MMGLRGFNQLLMSGAKEAQEIHVRLNQGRLNRAHFRSRIIHPRLGVLI